MDLFSESNVQISTLAVIVFFCITLNVVSSKLDYFFRGTQNRIQTMANQIQAMDKRIDTRLTRLEENVRSLQTTIQRKMDEYEQYKDSGCDDEQ